MDETPVSPLTEDEAIELTTRIQAFMGGLPQLSHCEYYFAVAVPLDRPGTVPNSIATRTLVMGAQQPARQLAELLFQTVRDSNPAALLQLYALFANMALEHARREMDTLQHKTLIATPEDTSGETQPQ